MGPSMLYAEREDHRRCDHIVFFSNAKLNRFKTTSGFVACFQQCRTTYSNKRILRLCIQGKFHLFTANSSFHDHCLVESKLGFIV